MREGAAVGMEVRHELVVFGRQVWKKSVEAAKLTTFLHKAWTTADPWGAWVNWVAPFSSFPLPTPTMPPDRPGNHVTRQGPHSLRGCLGAKTTSARQSGGEHHSDHKHKVMKRRYDSVRERKTDTAWRGWFVREIWTAASLCVRKTEGDFYCVEQVESGLCEGCGYIL